MAKTTPSPRWAKPCRQAYLADLFNRNQGFCIYGHSPCSGKWVSSQSIGCYWGKPCIHPINPDNTVSNPPIMCNHRPEDNKPILPCEVVHLTVNRWVCGYSNHACYKPFESHYTHIEPILIKDWVNEDRQDRLDLQRVEDIANHRTNDRTYPLHGQFSGIAKDVYYDSQPEYFIESYGVSGIDFKPFAKVRLASSPIRLFVTLEDILRPLSKNQRHKALRYKRIPATVQARIDYACLQAIKQFKRE